MFEGMEVERTPEGRSKGPEGSKRWQVGVQLGSGGQGSVHIAHHSDGTLAAAKAMPIAGLDTNQLHFEIDALKRLSRSTAVVNLIDTCEVSMV